MATKGNSEKKQQKMDQGKSNQKQDSSKGRSKK